MKIKLFAAGLAVLLLISSCSRPETASKIPSAASGTSLYGTQGTAEDGTAPTGSDGLPLSTQESESGEQETTALPWYYPGQSIKTYTYSGGSPGASGDSTSQATRTTATQERWRGTVTVDKQGIITHSFGTAQICFDGSARPGYTDASKNKHSEAGQIADLSGGRLVLKQEPGGANLDTTITPGAGELSLTQKISRAGRGISSVDFSMSVSDEYDVIIPAWSGIRLSREMPDIHLGFTRLAYPELWQAQMFLLQSDKGGLLIYAADSGKQFKALTVTHEKDRFNLMLETIPQAPFTGYTDFETVEWRMVSYKGGWMQGALLYKEYADKAFGASAINAAKPSWAADIGLVVLTDIEEYQMLVELAKHVDPSKTLLHVPGWRKEAYDVNYPDYTPDSTIKRRVQFAQSLGFKVGLHFNMIGADTSSSEYKSALSNVHSLDAFTKKPITEKYSAFGQSYSFAQINPASSAWRSMLVKKIKAVVNELGINAVHLDQSLLCFNDGRGLVDGMTSMQGNLALQRDLAAAMPNVAFSGEGLNEFNARYASWLQMHAYGIDSGSKAWDEKRFSQICPVSTVILGDAMNLYHYPAMPTTTDKAYYEAWYASGVRMGQLPTLMRISSTEISKANSAMKQTLRDALWYQNNRPKLYKADWKSDSALELMLKNGRTAVCRSISGDLEWS